MEQNQISHVVIQNHICLVKPYVLICRELMLFIFLVCQYENDSFKIR